MSDLVQDYIAGITPPMRPLFDRMHGLILGLHPDAELLLSYAIPTYKVGDRRIYVGAWKRWVSLYGWEEGRDGGFVERHPHLSSGRGTIRLLPEDAETIPDSELRALLRGALGD